MHRTQYFHTGKIKQMCNNEKIPTDRSNFDQTYLKFYNPLALDTPTFPPDNPEQLKDFYGVPASLNVINVSEKYGGGMGKYIMLNKK